MQSMIETVARAIASRQAELGEEKWRYCLPDARAAIEAMRCPTDAMIDAAHRSDPLACDVDHANDVYPYIWQGMIDAALNEKGMG